MSNFECPHCGMVNIDCGRDNYKTPKEIELEQKKSNEKRKIYFIRIIRRSTKRICKRKE